MLLDLAGGFTVEERGYVEIKVGAHPSCFNATRVMPIVTVPP